jgi:ATP-dependent Lon protease
MNDLERGDLRTIPVGFEMVRFDSGRAILLPTPVAQEWDEARAARIARLRAKEPSMPEVPTEQENKEPEVGEDESSENNVDITPSGRMYCVLPKLSELLDRATSGSTAGQSLDSEVVGRRKHAFAALTQRGAYRSVAIPDEWRARLDALEFSSPNFREPIAVVRNALALAEATGTPPRIPPMILVGPPGIGKTHFCHRLAESLCTSFGAVHFDQPTAGSQLRGSDKYWSNSESGLLFNMICLGEFANPVVLLDEVDKATRGGGSRDVDPLAQLHGALERETSRRLTDISLEVEFDASLVTYIATANTLRWLGAALLSRFHVVELQSLDAAERLLIAGRMVEQIRNRFGVANQVVFERSAISALSILTPRHMQRVAEQVLAHCLLNGFSRVDDERVFALLAPGASVGPVFH